MTKKYTITAIAASIALLAGVAQAESTPGNTDMIPGSGFYVGAGVGVGSYTISDRSFSSGLAMAGINLDAGYQFGRYFALGVSSFSMIGHGGVIAPTVLYAKGILPLSDRISLYGKLGAGALFATAPKDEPSDVVQDAVWMGGLGLNYQVTKSVAVGIEADVYDPMFANVWANFLTNDSRVSVYIPTVMANVTYHFGS